MRDRDMAKDQTNRPRSARSLSAALATSFLTLSVVILLVSGGLQLFFNIQTQQQAVSGQQQIIAQGAAKTVSSFIEEKFTVLSTAIWLANLNAASSEEQTQILKSLLARQSAFRQLAIFGANHNETALATRIQFTSSVASQQFIARVTDDILTQTEQKQNYISSVYFDEHNNEPLVLMAVPEIDAIGNFQGTLVAELNLISMWNLVNQLKVGETGYTYVVDRQGNLIAFEDTNRALQGENVSTIKSVNEFSLNPASASAKGATIYTGINGATVVGTFAPLGTPDWAVVTEMPWQEAYRGIIRVVIVDLGIILALVALAGVIGSQLARRITVPLVDLTETATAIAAGELERRAIVKNNDEVGTLASAFNNMAEQLKTLIGGLEERVAERTHDLERRSLELQIAAQIARDASLAQNIDTMLNRTAQLIRERFGYYHVGIFMVDDNGEYAVLVAAGGEAGQLMLAGKHKLKIGETGIVGNVAQAGKPRIALDVGADPVHLQSPLLPYTRSEMTLPLKIENRTIGVLDVQSDKVNAFDQNSVAIMQILTDQLSVAIGRLRLLQELQQGTEVLEQTLQDNTSRNWVAFMQQRGKHIGYHYEGVTIESIPEASPDILEAMQENELATVENDETGSTLKVLIRLHGQTLGILNLRFRVHEIPQETIRLVEEAANRLALALENARLVQDAQRLAKREQQINTISAQIQQSTDLEIVLQNTVRELGNALGVPKTFIQIGLTPPAHQPEKKRVKTQP
jgi:GAF domain-containing protein/HAMP domain-containing protein